MMITTKPDAVRFAIQEAEIDWAYVIAAKTGKSLEQSLTALATQTDMIEVDVDDQWQCTVRAYGVVVTGAMVDVLDVVVGRLAAGIIGGGDA